MLSMLIIGCSNFDGKLVKISPDKNDDYNWSYYLYIPSSVKKGVNTHLLVRPNNTGKVDDDIKVHDKGAKGKIKGMKDWAEELGTPILIPVFPRYNNEDLIYTYTHALDRIVLPQM